MTDLENNKDLESIKIEETKVNKCSSCGGNTVFEPKVDL